MTNHTATENPRTMIDHAHTLDDPRTCIECPPSRVKPADVRWTVAVLGLGHRQRRTDR